MAKLTQVQARNHAKEIVKLVIANLDSWCIDDDIYEEDVYNETESVILYYLSDNNLLDGTNTSEILQQALVGLWDYAIDEDLPGKAVRKAERLVYSELYD